MPESTISRGFDPGWVSPPGDTIADILGARNLSIAQFAELMGQTTAGVNALLQGRSPICIDTARSLSEVLGSTVEFWMNRDYLYRQGANRLLVEHREWLKALPMSEMVRRGWITPAPKATEEAAAALQFFGVSSVQAWRQKYDYIERLASFRTSRSFESRPAAVAAWLREGERQATALLCDPWNPDRFSSVLPTVRKLTKIGDPQRFLPRLRELCASTGVAVIGLRAPNGCRASGATRFVSHDKALLLLSFRHLTDDHFWYTFFHEAGHLLLHDLSQGFIDGLDDDDDSRTHPGTVADIFTTQEREADAFALRMLLPLEADADITVLRAEVNTIIRFARRAGVSPGIVVGQLQHLGRVRRNQFNTLKRRYAWSADGSTVVLQAR